MGEKMDCKKAKQELQDYLKRELTPELADEMKAHLERCRPCFDRAKFEENYLLMMEARVRCQTCPEHLRDRILALLSDEAEPR